MNSRALHIHIDRLVVNGLSAGSRQRFVRSLESELAALAEDHLHAGAEAALPRRIGSVDAGVLRPGATAEQAAGQIASAMRTSLAGKETARRA